MSNKHKIDFLILQVLFLWPLFLLGLFAFLGCSKTTYIPFEDGAKTVGKGGAIHKVNGIEVWTDGNPDRPYKIIGVIHDSRSGLRKGSIEKNAAKIAKKMGGDALLEYQTFGLTPGGVTGAIGGAAGNVMWIAAQYSSAAAGPIAMGAVAAAALASSGGGKSRWWVAKYLPEDKISKTEEKKKTTNNN
ncbi:hypothetical protein [Candidatus Methylacidiphilum infernorum]|uniref:hypothetical protein n=1 Tax=Candidatus Methylacidiphilum infernorum TaxID=511746 RepID=UPI0002F717E4|nr:hypothetical protein [Candidatus Methylacidiphilum infernorum]